MRIKYLAAVCAMIAGSITFVQTHQNVGPDIIISHLRAEALQYGSPVETVCAAVSPEAQELPWSEEELEMLAKMTMAEAEGEPLEGKCMVVRVILNRAESDLFPDSIYEVITEKGQFTSYTNGRYLNAVPSDEVWDAVTLVCKGAWDASDGALFFEVATNKSTWQSRNRDYLRTIGKHNFYK